MDNPAECKVCFISFSTEEHRPRTLPCGHTFCSTCITSLLEEAGGRLTCPTCRVQHTAPGAAHFPINYGMEAVIQQMKCLAEQQGVPDTVEDEQEEISDFLSSEVDVLKQDLISIHLQGKNFKTQLLQREEQLRNPLAQHLSLLNHLCDMVVNNKMAVTRLMETQERYRSLHEEGKDILGHLEAIMEKLDSSVSLQEKKAVIYLARNRTQEVMKWIKQLEVESVEDQAFAVSSRVLEATQGTFKRIATEGVGDGEAGSSVDVFCPIQLSSILGRLQHSLGQSSTSCPTLTTEDLHSMRPDVRRLLEAGKVYGIDETTGDLHTSKITLECGRLHLYHLLNRPLPHNVYTVQMTGYLAGPHPSLLVFLDLAWSGQVRGRVYIRLHLDIPLARQFLLLCCGSRGYTYAGTSLLKVCGLHNQGEFIMGGDYTCDDGSGGPPLLPELHGDYRKTGRAGSVWGRWEVEDHRAAQFAITTRDCRGTIPRVFGCVEEGFGVVKEAVAVLGRARVKVDNCGVVLGL